MMQNKINHIIYLIGLLLLIANCTGIYEDGNELAKVAEKKIHQISVDELKAKVEKQEEEFLLIDVRQKSEFKKGNIEGSYSIPRGILEFKIGDKAFWEEEYIDPPADTTLIIIYCAKGARGALATESLLKLGYKNVLNLEGGYGAFNPNPDENAPVKEEGGCGG
jgi:rhodanese-related sulfurtransferase